jgi:predicted dehydrogenase
MMRQPVSVVLVGIGGMGGVYLSALLQNKENRNYRLAGAVDPEPGKSRQLAELRALDIPVFGRLEEFYDRHRADLAVIASPIHFHCEQTCLALSRGSRVLCEKPAAGTVQEVLRMREAERKSGTWVAVGFQWSFSPAIQALKNDIRNGMYGRPRRLKCLYLWPRSESYYKRNDWAGKLRDSEERWILDSPVNNAMAHDLHNMFYVLGRERETAARPVQIEAELYRAYEIENFDTAALRLLTADGVEMLFYVSHAAAVDRGPVLSYEFERGEIRMSGRDTDIKGFFPGGEKGYGSPDGEPMRKLWEAIDSANGRNRPACGLEASLGLTLAVDGAQDSSPGVRAFPPELIVSLGEPGSREIEVAGLAEVLEACYGKNALPSDLGVRWSRRGRPVSLLDYVYFPGGKMGT